METQKCCICGKTAIIDPKKGDIFHMSRFGMDVRDWACTSCVGEEKKMFFDVGYNTWLPVEKQ